MEYNFDNFINIIKNYNPEEVESITMAYKYAETLHENQYRASGEKYIVHPLAVATMLANVKADKATVIAALLHDVIEDTPVTEKEISSIFGSEITNLVLGVTKVSEITSISKEEINRLTIKKLILSVTNDVRILIIKLFDRVHNMSTLEFLNEEKQKRISAQTMDIYAPLAYYLGAYNIKRTLEDLSFKYLEFNEYCKVDDNIKQIKSKKMTRLYDIMEEIKKNLHMQGFINSNIDVRVKSIYRTYLKLNEGYTYDNMFDLFSYKILNNDEEDCYKILKFILNTYKSHDRIIKDYIGKPKDNNYRALHTQIDYTPKEVVQLKIMTNMMDFNSTYGLIGYWQDLKGDAAKEMLYNIQTTDFYKIIEEIKKYSESSSEVFVGDVTKKLLSNKEIHKS